MRGFVYADEVRALIIGWRNVKTTLPSYNRKRREQMEDRMNGEGANPEPTIPFSVFLMEGNTCLGAN